MTSIPVPFHVKSIADNINTGATDLRPLSTSEIDRFIRVLLPKKTNSVILAFHKNLRRETEKGLS